METTEEKIRISSYGNNSITLTGLTGNECELIKAAIHGHQHITVIDGRISAQSTYEPLPESTKDEEMLPFWRVRQEGSSEMQQVLFDRESLDHHFPSIFISSLCGYYYTPESYRCEAEKLERWGFICMRSRRGTDGCFWEFWYLPGLYSAKEGLKDALFEKKDSNKQPSISVQTKRAVSFLGMNCSFGSLDVVVQKLAMVIE